MKKETEDLVKELYKLGFTNVDVLTKDGKVSAKDIINKQEPSTPKLKFKRKGKKK